ncbi:MAG: hypothetical protein ACI87H_003752 [Gammaproteobacteria bacterium]
MVSIKLLIVDDEDAVESGRPPNSNRVGKNRKLVTISESACFHHLQAGYAIPQARPERQSCLPEHYSSVHWYFSAYIALLKL